MAPEVRVYTTELSRELDLYHLTMRGLGVMIGAGVFFGIGTSIATAGPGGLLLTFALNGLLALLTAMSYAEMSSAAPYAGGAYDFARLAFGRRLGFLAGWTELMAACAASAMYATTLALYVVHYLGALGVLRWLPAGAVVPIERVVAALVAALFIGVHWVGAEGTGRGSARVTVFVLLFFALIGAAGVAATLRDPSRLAAFGAFLPFGWSPLPVAMGLTFVAFEGFEVIAQAGDEAKRPRKNLPKAMLYAVLVATAAYMVVAVASVVGAGPAGGRAAAWQWVASYGATGFGEVASRLLPGGWLLPTLAVAVACSLALNATVASAARSAYALGRDRMLPSMLTRLSRSGGAPVGALIATGALIVPATLLVPITDLAAGASLMFLLVFTLVNLAAIRARFERGHELHYGFVTPAFPLPQIVAVGAHIILALALARVSRAAWLLPQVWVLAGLVIYQLYSRTRALPLPDEGLVLEETGPPAQPGRNNDLMIAISSPENALALVGGAARLCGEEERRMQLLHMVPAPAPVSLSDAKAYMKEGKEGLIEAMLYLYSRYPVSTTVRYCRNIARGILTAVRERKAGTLILGWHGQNRDQKFHIGSTLDPVLARAPCDVIVFKDCGDRVFRNILVAILGGPSDVLALRTAVLMAEREGGRIKALLPQRWGGRKKIRQKFNQLLERTDLHTVEVRTQVATVADMTRAVIRRAPRYDMVVLGVNEPLVPGLASPLAIPEAIARRCKRPMVIVKAHRRLPRLDEVVDVRAVRSPGIGRVEVVEIAAPRLAPGHAIVRIEAVALCGSDLRRLYYPRPEDLPLPVGAPGHELIGTIEAVDGAGTLRVGERALILAPLENSMMERVAAPAECVLPLPPGRPAVELLMAQQLGTVLYAARYLPPMVGLTAAVIGQGSAGLHWNRVLRRLGAARVISLDLTEARVAAAPRFGATHAVNNSRVDALTAVREITGGELPDLVVEACGEPSGINLAISLVRVGGRIQFFGVPHAVDFPFDYWTLFRKYCTTHSTGRSTFEADKSPFRLALELIASGEVDVRGMVTHRLPFERVAEAYELARTREDGALKVVVDMV